MAKHEQEHLVPILTKAKHSKRYRIRYKSTLIGDLILLVIAAAILGLVGRYGIRALSYLVIQLPTFY